jgi:integrase
MAAIRKRTNKKGIVWQIDYYDPEGKRVMKCFPLKKDAEAYLGKVQASKREGRYHDVFDMKKETQITFNTLADTYVKNFDTQKSFKGFKSHVIEKLRKSFGNWRLSEIAYKDLETFRNHRKSALTKAKKIRADASVNRDMAIFGHMLNKAVEWEMLETSPLKGKRLMFKENNQRLRFLNEAEIEALLRACSPHLRPIVETALLTGMRRGELLSLKWEQIRNGFIYLTETKSGKARQIPINDRLTEMFREVRRGNQLKSAYVFCDSQGRRFLEVKRSFTSACRRAGIEDFRFHDLRHTFASHFLMRGGSLKALQEILGHADIKMTMRYAHLSNAHLKESISLLNSLTTGKEMVNIPHQNKKADSLTSVNLL